MRVDEMICRHCLCWHSSRKTGCGRGWYTRYGLYQVPEMERKDQVKVSSGDMRMMTSSAAFPRIELRRERSSIRRAGCCRSGVPGIPTNLGSGLEALTLIDASAVYTEPKWPRQVRTVNFGSVALRTPWDANDRYHGVRGQGSF